MDHLYFETERFYVRRWETEDAEALAGIMADPRVHIYTGDCPWTLARAQKYIDLMRGPEFFTLKVFHGACQMKATGQIVGFTGLNPYLPGQPELEWQLGVPFWGRGIATEVGRACLENAFRMTDITSVFGMAHPDNIASQRALKKIGMTRVGLAPFHGKPAMFYRIDRL